MKVSNNYKRDYYNLEKDNSNDKYCYLKFSQCDDNNFQLWKLKKEELKKFISYAKKVESLKWQEIQQHHGLNFEKLRNIDVPDYIDENIQIYSMRVDEKFRILGYRSDRAFYIVWFDNNHKTC